MKLVIFLLIAFLVFDDTCVITYKGIPSRIRLLGGVAWAAEETVLILGSLLWEQFLSFLRYHFQ